MKKKAIWILVLIAVLAALAIPKIIGSAKGQTAAPSKPGAASSAQAKGGSGSGPASAKGQGSGKGAPVPVVAAVVTPRPLIEKIVSPGTILASESVELKSEMAGRLIALDVREGGRVAKGTLLAKINDADLQAQALKANAVFVLAQTREASQKTLLETGAVSRDIYESVVRDLEAARADVALLRAQIEKTEVRAPFDGRVGMKYVSLGAYVSPGTKITTLVCDRPIKVDFSVSEKYASRIGNGDKVVLRLQGGSRTYAATVYAIDPMIDEATRTMRIRALCTDPDNGITPGAFAEVTLTLETKGGALMVPSSALVPDATGQKIFRIREGKAVAVPVTTGIRDSILVEITSGLQPGDTVVIKGVLMVRSGAAVTVTVEQ